MPPFDHYMEEGEIGRVGDLRLWLRIVRLGVRHRWRLAAAICLSFVLTAATMALPWLLQQAIDLYIMTGSLPKAERFAGITTSCLWYGVLVASVFFVSFAQILLLEYIGQSIMHQMRQSLFIHLMGRDLAFFHEHPSGRLVTRLTNDIQNMYEMFTSVMVTIFNDILRMFSILVFLVWMSPLLGAWMVAFVPLAALVSVFFARLSREQFRQIRSQLAVINSYLAEAIAGIAMLRIFARAVSASRLFHAMSREFYRRTLGQIKVFGLFMPMTELMSTAAIALILWFGGGEVIHKRLTLGELVAFISYMRLFFQPLRELSQNYSIVQSAMASAERIFELLDEKNIMPAADPPVPLPAPRGETCFDNIIFGYKADEPVIHGLNLRLPPGATVALVGATGSGKTTLLNLLLRFYDPWQGRVTIDGVDIREVDVARLRQVVGVILQDSLILQDTLLANIVMDAGASRQQVEEILTRTGMNHFVGRLPAGLDTMLGEGGQELSTGEKQLLSFARVLCRNPRILVLDEATAAIDTESENILEEAMATVFAGRTSLIIAHRLSTIKRASHIVVMAHGRIVEEGRHDDLLALGGAYANMVALDMKTAASMHEIGSAS
ncbi:MAG: ABC transporter ATP-binding protein/permease [Desulfobulbaceae bacterium]|jgi:ATP-binding cassette subfamily B protein|nr:ABC transporter ATP-binding protein/permease [Desulfobulbaceae bacterium]